MNNTIETTFSTSTYRSRVERTFSGILFIASAIVYVGGTLAMLLSNITTVA